MKIISFIVLTFLVSLGGCKTNNQPPDYIARVGNSFLTQSDIIENVGSLSDTSNLQVRIFVNKWIENEILFQEASKEGLVGSKEIERQVAEVRKQLAIQSLLENKIYNDSIQFSEDKLRDYYSKHSDEFVLREDVVRLNIASFTDRQYATEFRNLILKNKEWNDALESFQSSETKASSIHSEISDALFTQLTLYPTELWKVIRSLSINDVSFPIKSGDTYYIVQVVEKYPQGSKAELALVRKEIVQRLITQERRMKYDSLISSLRKKYNIELKLKNDEKN